MGSSCCWLSEGTIDITCLSCYFATHHLFIIVHPARLSAIDAPALRWSSVILINILCASQENIIY